MRTQHVIMRKILLYVAGKDDKMGRKNVKSIKILFGRPAVTRSLAISKSRFENTDKIALRG